MSKLLERLIVPPLELSGERYERNRRLIGTGRPVVIVDMSCLAYVIYFSQCRSVFPDEIADVLHIALMGRIMTLLETLRTNKIILAFDSKVSIRDDIYPAYKRARHTQPRPPEEIKRLRIMKEAIKTFRTDLAPYTGFNTIQRKGFEVDDICGIFARGYPETRFIMVATDGDLHQLLNGRTQLYHPVMNTLIGARDFQKKYGHEAHLVAAKKCVGGCPSDGIKGVPGIGELRATQFVQGKLNEKHMTVIRDNWNIVERNRKLVVLPHEALALPKLVPFGIDVDGFFKLMRILGVRTRRKPADLDRFFNGVH